MKTRKDDLLNHLICPDCRKPIEIVDGNTLMCTGCRRNFSRSGEVINMLPHQMKRNSEDFAWKTLPYEGADKPDWMALLHKKDRLLYFYERILPEVDFDGKILEIGAGSCWASALIKKKHPENLVVASDISPFALGKGVKVSRLLDSGVDYYVACNAECLPFSDEYFDVVFSNATIHHFSDPRMGIQEMRRVLKKCGKCYALGEVASGALFKAILTSRMGPAGKRARSLKIEENIYSLNEWKAYFRNCGFKDVQVSFDKTWEHKLYHWLTALYYRILSTIPDLIIDNFLPCNIDIYAIKT